MTLFRHGVASGDPATDRVVIWTRATTDEDRPISLRWTVAHDARLADVVAQGEVEATADTDYAVQVDVGGLEPDTHYWYAFNADGDGSPVGRTRTLPLDADHIRFAVVSCAKFNAGFFNGYGAHRRARRSRISCCTWATTSTRRRSTPPANQTPGADIGRPFEPLNECVTLDDYRTRYAQYRADPDTQAAARRPPVDRHARRPRVRRRRVARRLRRARAGARRAVGRRAARRRSRRAASGCPIRLPDPADPDRVYRSVSFGDLADLFLIDTRSRRDQPRPGPRCRRPAADAARARAARRGCSTGCAARPPAGGCWQLSILGRTWAPDIPKELHDGLALAEAIHASDGGPDADQWDGYPGRARRCCSTTSRRERRRAERRRPRRPGASSWTRSTPGNVALSS